MNMMFVKFIEILEWKAPHESQLLLLAQDFCLGPKYVRGALLQEAQAHTSTLKFIGLCSQSSVCFILFSSLDYSVSLL